MNCVAAKKPSTKGKNFVGPSREFTRVLSKLLDDLLTNLLTLLIIKLESRPLIRMNILKIIIERKILPKLVPQTPIIQISLKRSKKSNNICTLNTL
tara:strand:+ start:156 stop:443 length:288 start_codon:yes stop_codon:yes gene_type:complete